MAAVLCKLQSPIQFFDVFSYSVMILSHFHLYFLLFSLVSIFLFGAGIFGERTLDLWVSFLVFRSSSCWIWKGEIW